MILHYGFGTATGALYGALALHEEPVTAGFGGAFGGIFFIVGYVLAPEDLKPYVNNSQRVSEIYEWLTHVIYGVSMEGTRRAVSALLLKPRTA